MILPDLPVSKRVNDIVDALTQGNLVLSAQTGSGKTTVVPPYLAEHASIAGRILVLEPRRLAARAAASRAAALLGQELGQSVGYSVRGDSKRSERTRVEYITTALFLRRVQDDPFLDGVSLVVFDEFHERSLVADLSLAFSLEALSARPELRLAIMSATLDTQRVAAHLGARVLEVAGRTFPVDLAYRAPQSPELQHRLQAGAQAVSEALASGEGDVLVFLPGGREIAAIKNLLASLPSTVSVLSLDGSMSLSEQNAIIAPPYDAGRRVILSTNVAEASITVPRITAVVDLGLSRFLEWDESSGMNRLNTAWLSEAEAEQRRGRAGRLEPGICYRIWSQSDMLIPQREPEILRSDLSALVLECAYRGIIKPAALRWLDRPKDGAWARAMKLLRSSALLHSTGTISARGRIAANLGTDPRFGAAIAAALETGQEAMFHAAALEAALFASSSRRASSLTQQACADESVLQEANRLCMRAGSTAFNSTLALSHAHHAGDALAPGFPDRLAKLCPDGTWLFASGKKAKLAASVILGPRTEWLVATNLDALDSLAVIREALAVHPDSATAALKVSAIETEEIRWKGLSLSVWSVLSHGAIVLRERRMQTASSDTIVTALQIKLDKEGLAWLPWDDSCTRIVERIRYASRMGTLAQIEESDWSEAALCSSLARFIAPYLAGSNPSLCKESLRLAILDRLGQAGRAELERQAPDTLTTPGGRVRKPSYPANGEARLAMRIQEAFGLIQSPSICGKALVIELLNPADLIIQTTADLAGFWERHYPGIRQELKRRYPKHHWPEDPRSALATRGLPPKS